MKKLSDTYLFVSTIAIAAILWYINTRTHETPQPQEHVVTDERYVKCLGCQLSPSGYRNWKTLLNMSLGDTERAKNLIFHEKGRRPSMKMEDIIELVIEEWRRDINR